MVRDAGPQGGRGQEGDGLLGRELHPSLAEERSIHAL